MEAQLRYILDDLTYAEAGRLSEQRAARVC